MVAAAVAAVSPTVVAAAPEVGAPFHAPDMLAILLVRPPARMAEGAGAIRVYGRRGNRRRDHQQQGGNGGDHCGFQQLFKHRAFLLISIR